MKLGALYSGGKDSTFAILKALEAGHSVACVITVTPTSDESMLFHYSNSWLTRYQAEAMNIPLVEVQSLGLSKESEEQALASSVTQAISLYGIEGIVHGGIASEYQRQAFERVCSRHGVKVVSPLWHSDPLSYMNELVDRGFEIIIVSVSAMGLDREWLGRRLDKSAVNTLAKLSAKHGFNLNFEGGEAETLVTDCPLFSKKVVISKATVVWDGQRGMFEILDAALVDKEQK